MSSELRNRNRKKDAVAPVSEQLTRSINDKNPGAAVMLIKYWGNMSGVTTGKIISVDESGVDIQYTLGAKPQKHELRLQFKKTAETPAEAREMIEKMTSEARFILGVEIDKNYKPVGHDKRKKPDYEHPDIVTMFFMTLLWIFAFSVAFLDDTYLPVPIVITRTAVGLQGAQRLLIALVIINGMLTLLTLVFCVFARVPLWATLLWMPTVMAFGVPSMQASMKVAIKYLLPRYPEFFGVPTGVLPDDPITIANNAKIEEIKRQQAENEKRRH